MKTMLQQTIAHPQGGSAQTITTEIDWDKIGDDLTHEEYVTVALDLTKTAADAWEKWSDDQLTPEQRELKKQAIAMMKQRDELAREEIAKAMRGE